MTPLDKAGIGFLALTALVLTFTIMLQGTDMALLNPKGLIAREQFRLIVFSVSVMLAIAVPVLSLLYFFAWKYRESNPKATYDSTVRYGKLFGVFIWALPATVIFILATNMLSATHKLVPQQAIASSSEPLTIQVIAMRWKWLFIYPEQNIATVNFVQIPVDTPVRFELTADESPMTSFWIPHFGGQLYAMTGHVNALNLLADNPGDYPGSSAEISGVGFAGMKFTARASSMQSFESWVKESQQSASVLDSSEYRKLLQPTENNNPVYYSSADDNIYNNVVMKYAGTHNHLPTIYRGRH